MIYLRGRSASCRYLDVTSVCHAVRTDVPQGSPISPLIFNLFVSTYHNNVHFHTGRRACSKVVREATRSSKRSHSTCWGCGAQSRERDLQISAPKSRITLFTSDIHQSYIQPSVVLSTTSRTWPQSTRGNFLPEPHFHPHIETIKETASARLKIVKALSGTN